ncbi:MAG: acetyl-CoA carboxylase biotin carboxylase subunit [Clostridiales bacterium GWF2_38_85]|nr:MAG: acetyl-CoA carboxylase biotin carboxylase subunit [Clostridiales bacterium GWF2_38_85]HBL85240.1 acetyl-CoA carboxylase biotin carboxylase subunit [Clostridiales bacterium]
MFSKILIANRGEIAVRIIRACKEMGISTVAVFSEADRNAMHVSLADESYCVGAAQVKDSYLNISAILTIAVSCKVEAIHPGYGLLSENAKFSAMCEQCGIVFIGAKSEVIKKMGDKNAARITMRNAGVPVINGSEIIDDMTKAKVEAEKIGYPIMIKASAGGGGKGIRVVEKQAELANAFTIATTEAKAAFGDGSVYMEKYLTSIKHIEMQIICDNYGNIVCLGERDCSVQRNNQKMIEESPSTVVTVELRKKLIDTATKTVQTVGYTGVGTIEFLLDKRNNYYFCEMNTRLQVEHPVTEMVTGIDLVKWQIRVAAGIAIDFTQAPVKFYGHAIECRINAEDPKNKFKPCAGKITFLHIPGGPWIRFDTAIYQDYIVPPFYDSLLGKLIVYAPTREEALRKMKAALCELVIEGIDTNIDYLLEIVSSETFTNGDYSTDVLKNGGIDIV